MAEPVFTITSVKLRSRTGSSDASGNGYEDIWIVRFTGPYDCAALLNNSHADLPHKHVLPEWDDTVIADKIGVKLDDGSRADGKAETGGGQAIYTVSYSPLTFDRQQKAVSPMDREPIIEGGGSDLTQVLNVEAKAEAPRPLANSAGDLYPNPPEQFLRGGDYSITFNVAENPVTFAETFSNTTNATEWHGKEPETVMIGKISYRKVVEVFGDAAVTYYTVTVPIKTKRDGWRWKPLDAGLYRVSTEGNARIQDASNPPQDVVEPVPLDGFGSVLPPGDDPIVFPTDGYVVFEAVDWTDLDLPNPWA